MAVRLLIDENLSDRLVRLVADAFPDSTHVFEAGLGGASDQAVWEFAHRNDLVLVTKDEDFQQLSATRGAPPKVLWIRLGNCATSDVARLLAENHETIEAFVADEFAAFLPL